MFATCIILSALALSLPRKVYTHNVIIILYCNLYIHIYHKNKKCDHFARVTERGSSLLAYSVVHTENTFTLKSRMIVV